MQNFDIEKLTQNVCELVIEVGKFIRNESLNFNQSSTEYKGLNDLVSYVDKSAEQQLVKRLKVLLPESGFITEEKTETIIAEHYNWIIDPLDGTTNFIHGIPTYSISIALQRNGILVLGVVYEIVRDECFYSFEGGKAWMNKKQISVSSATGLNQSLIATGFPYYQFENMDSYLEILKVLMQKTHGLRRIGSAAVDLVYTACGRFDGYFEYNLNAWDVAGGAFILQQAGGIVTDFAGTSDFINQREIVCGNPKVYQDLMEIVKKHW